MMFLKVVCVREAAFGGYGADGETCVFKQSLDFRKSALGNGLRHGFAAEFAESQVE